MARRPSQAQVYQDLADRYGVRVADAFFRAMQDLRRQADIRQVLEALERRDYEDALRALHIEEAAFADLLEAVREGYREGGRTAGDYTPARTPDGAVLVTRFDTGNPQAEAEAREHGARLVRRITDEIRQSIRFEVAEGLRQGLNPRQIVPNIVGRVSRATGQREGGILGLTEPQAQAVRRAREELASGEPSQLRNYLERGRRDRRFDRTVQKAIREGVAPPADKQAAMILAYERKLLALRGEIIGRTEAMAAIHAGQHRALIQAVQEGKLKAENITRVWRSAGDFRVRHTHRALDRESVGLDGVFVSPSGARMRYPGDTSLGAPASETVGCRCTISVRVDWFANVR